MSKTIKLHNVDKEDVLGCVRRELLNKRREADARAFDKAASQASKKDLVKLALEYGVEVIFSEDE